MPLILGANSASAGGYEIDNSLRFNAGSTDYLYRTNASAGNRKTWTYSFWVKRVKIDDVEPGNYASLLTAGNDGTELFFQPSAYEGQLNFYYYSTGAYVFSRRTTASVRDVSAWYHIVLALDTTQATESNRLKIYVNGVLQTLTGTPLVPQNTETDINNNVQQNIGRYGDSDTYAPRKGNYYLAEVNFINAQQLDASYFGETDTATGIWKPKEYTGTYGTNGFYLKFENSAALGTDSSGNGNNFTVNNLTSIDQTTDTPTNNFATLNPLFAGSNAPTITEGNLKATNTGVADYQGASGTIPASTTGKWYWEFKSNSNVNGSSTETLFGAVRETTLSSTSNQSAEFAGDNITVYGSGPTTIASGDIIGVTVDRASAELKIYKNNSLILTKTSLFNEPLFPYIAVFGSGVNIECNFGNPPYSVTGYADANGFGNFTYAPPSGFYALCTKNLAQYG
jgi:hypothetical protein